MTPQKKLQDRERELQILHSTPAGLIELKAIAAEYARVNDRPFPEGESVITYILVYERDKKLIFV